MRILSLIIVCLVAVSNTSFASDLIGESSDYNKAIAVNLNHEKFNDARFSISKKRITKATRLLNHHNDWNTSSVKILKSIADLSKTMTTVKDPNKAFVQSMNEISQGIEDSVHEYLYGVENLNSIIEKSKAQKQNRQAALDKLNEETLRIEVEAKRRVCILENQMAANVLKNEIEKSKNFDQSLVDSVEEARQRMFKPAADHTRRYQSEVLQRIADQNKAMIKKQQEIDANLAKFNPSSCNAEDILRRKQMRKQGLNELNSDDNGSCAHAIEILNENILSIRSHLQNSNIQYQGSIADLTGCARVNPACEERALAMKDVGDDLKNQRNIIEGNQEMLDRITEIRDSLQAPLDFTKGVNEKRNAELTAANQRLQRNIDSYERLKKDEPSFDQLITSAARQHRCRD